MHVMQWTLWLSVSVRIPIHLVRTADFGNRSVTKTGNLEVCVNVYGSDDELFGPRRTKRAFDEYRELR
jgi:hypothetical protein